MQRCPTCRVLALHNNGYSYSNSNNSIGNISNGNDSSANNSSND